MLWHSSDLQPPTAEHEHILHAQTITLDEPGPLVRDFETLLDFVGEGGIRVSAGQHLFYAQHLPELNARLSHPLKAQYKRPVQQGYPYIHGLYLLLRASGLSYIVEEGRHHHMRLREPVIRSWDTLNPTERYMTLLEAWLNRAEERPLFEGYPEPISNLDRAWQFMNEIAGTGYEAGSSLDLRYHPGYHNLALMDLFGFVELEEEGTEAGADWHVTHVTCRPFGEAMLQLLSWLQQEKVRDDADELNWLDARFDHLQLTRENLYDFLHDYFPAWHNHLELPASAFRADAHTFKVSLDTKLWRRLAVPGTAPLDTLAHGILEAFAFEDWAHLYRFTYTNVFGLDEHIWHPYAQDEPSTDEVRVGDVPLQEGAHLTFVFDFGDWWVFDVLLDRVDPENVDVQEVALLDGEGDPPPQYPDLENDDEAWW